jgi:hypothetical protein
VIGRLGVALLGVLAVAAAPRPATAGEERLTLSLRGGAYDRDDDGYADHAAVFGLRGAELGGGGVIEGGVRVWPRLWLYASWSGFTSATRRRLDELQVTNQAFLVQAGVTVFRRDELFGGGLPFSIRVDVLAGGGLYSLKDDLDGASHSVRGPGLRAGSQVTISWRSLGFITSYGLHLARVSLEDRVGGELRAGGNEIGAGVSVGF